MSSDLNKRIADLEQELHEAREAKYRLEDELNAFTSDSDNFANWRKSLAGYEEAFAETSEKIQELTESKESLLKLLDEAKSAANSIDTLNEELAAATDIAQSKQGTLDEVMMSIHMLEAKLHDLENSQSLLQQEFELAKINEEYVGGLQKKIDSIVEDVEALNADLREADTRKYNCEQHLFTALKSCQQLEIRIEESSAKAEDIIPLEYKLAELGDVLAEEQDKLESHVSRIKQIQENMDARGPVNESQNSELEAYNARIVELTDSLTEARSQLDQLLETESQLSEEVTAVLDAVDQCTQYSEIYNLEESFNKVGMTIQKTINDRMVLGRCQDNKIVTENVIDDYIFVGPAKRPLHEGVINKVKSFVLANEGTACTPTHEPITIMNEDKKFTVDFMVESERSL